MAAGLAESRATLIEAGDQVLAAAQAGTRRRLVAACTDLGVEILTGTRIVRLRQGTAELPDGRTLAADFAVSAAGARAHDWIAQTGLSQTNGFIDVGADLRSLNDPAVFAVGDCANLTHAPRPKAGVFAVRRYCSTI